MDFRISPLLVRFTIFCIDIALSQNKYQYLLKIQQYKAYSLMAINYIAGYTQFVIMNNSIHRLILLPSLSLSENQDERLKLVL